MHSLKAIIARKGRFCCSLKTGDFWLLNGCFRNCLPMRSHRKWWKNCWSKWFTRVEANFHCERFFTAQFSFVVVLFIKSIFICILNVVIRVNDSFFEMLSWWSTKMRVFCTVRSCHFAWAISHQFNRSAVECNYFQRQKNDNNNKNSTPFYSLAVNLTSFPVVSNKMSKNFG